MTVRVFAPAKINLTLHVTGQQDDGYHLLDSLVAFADVGDEVSVSKGAGLTLAVSGPEAAEVPNGEDNSVLQAARFLGTNGLALSLKKHLPISAGIGGGSSDSAAALKAISQFCGTPIPDNTLPLGADVPVCLHTRATRMSGIGEVLIDVPELPEIYCVLANPRVAVSTPEVFRQLKNKNNPAMPATLPKFGSAQKLADWLAGQRNDLEETAQTVQPVIADVLSGLSGQHGQLLTRMSGSGATSFALFATRDQAASAAQDIRHDHPDWWIANTRLS